MAEKPVERSCESGFCLFFPKLALKAGSETQRHLEAHRIAYYTSSKDGALDF